MDMKYLLTTGICLTAIGALAQTESPCAKYSDEGISKYCEEHLSSNADRVSKRLMFWFEHDSIDDLKQASRWASERGYEFSLRSCQLITSYDKKGNENVENLTPALTIWITVEGRSESFVRTVITEVREIRKKIGITDCGTIAVTFNEGKP